ncbi:related to cytoskeletal adaptor [Phialocephala subalpina]|uniref:Related to cytoskeletal adaptor n=1 Tax=Phialocephala subalpina TaxID=576137 RepID=A0A1L7WR95_9HELO|nr:related to cytoskeletal adaptor [Phialocephala subalpina]
MDLASLKEAAANLTLYDLKAGVRKVQNAVMNYTEMEAKVREATNNEPWGASSSLMQEIANGTYNYQLLNEIMPMIYKRFTEKAAEEWRQIYKALQLLEFLIKNGSERVIDDARSHLTLLKMLRQFHFIDANGKDQGVNVRNRAKELAELLSDVDKIRAERKKARATRNKYTGVEGGAGLGGGLSSSSRYGGFGSEEAGSGSGGGGYGGYSGGVYGDGGGFGGQTSDFQDSGSRDHSATGRRDRFDEYDEYDEGAVAAPSRRQAENTSSSSSSSRRKTTERAAAKKPEPPKKKEPEVDLFSFDDPIPTTSAPIAAPAASNAVVDDDDFDDFQSATPSGQTSAPSFPTAAPTATTTSTTQYAAPQPVSAPKAANLTDLVGFSSISPATSTTATPVNYSAFSPPAVVQQPRPQPTGYQGSQPNYFTSVQAPANNQAKPASSASSSIKSPPGSKPAPGGDAFGSLWSSASAGIKKTSTPTSGPALGQLAKEKASAGIWGAGSSTSSTPMAQQQRPPQGQQSLGNGLDDLLG